MRRRRAPDPPAQTCAVRRAGRSVFAVLPVLPLLLLAAAPCGGAEKETAAGKRTDAERFPAAPEALLRLASDLGRPYRERAWAGERLTGGGAETRSVLVAGLEAERSVVRQTAAHLLGEAGGTEALSPLRAAARAEDPLLRRAAERALVRILSRQRSAALLAHLRPSSAVPAPDDAPDSFWTVVLLKAVAGTETPPRGETASALLDAAAARLASPEPTVRLAAVRAVGALGGGARGSGAGMALLSRLDAEEDGRVRAALLAALGGCATQEAGERIRACVDQTEPEPVRLEAAGALLALGYDGAAEGVGAFLAAGAAGLRLRAVELLAAYGGEAGRGPLVEALEDEVWSVRYAAVRALGALPAGGIPDALRRRMEDADPRVRAAALVELDRRGLSGARDRLREEARTGSPPRRIAAVVALGRLRDSGAAKALAACLEAESIELACRAAEALGRSAAPDEAVLPPLLEALEEGSPPLEEAARRALRRRTGRDPGPDAASRRAWRRWRGLQK